MARVFQSDVGPRFAGVVGAVHAVAIGYVAAQAALASAHIQNVRVRRRHRDAADGRDVLFIELRRPMRAAIDALPYSPRGRTEVISLRIAGDPGDCQDPSAAKWPDKTVLHALEQVLADLPEGGMSAEKSDEEIA
jgi:hypothetical protein